jgi:DNA-binding Lrp family transcriptional regulator
MLLRMSEAEPSRWKFLTNHAQVLVCIAHDPGVRLREISERVGITERAAHRIVDDLVNGDYIKRERVGRRNRYTIQTGMAMPDRVGRVKRIGELLEVLGGTDGTGPATAERATRTSKRIAAKV